MWRGLSGPGGRLLTATSVLLLGACAREPFREEEPQVMSGGAGSGGVGSGGVGGGVVSTGTTGGESGPDTKGPESTSGAESSSTDTTQSGGFLFDVAGGDETGTGGSSECERVDLLFVIDDSSSMAGEQQNLIASFPAFIQGIQAGLAGVSSYHVGVVTTNSYGYNSLHCREIGALVTSTGGAKSSDTSCGPFSEGRYLVSGDDLEQQFACIAQVGTSGFLDERPMQAMQTAVGPIHAVSGGCNEGFVRDNALLVVVIVTDEEDQVVEFGDTTKGSPGGPQTWFEELVATKTYEENIAVLSIIGGQPDSACLDDHADNGAEDAPRIRAFTEMFTNGFLGDVCAPSYGSFFNEAIDVVQDACGGFIPPEG